MGQLDLVVGLAGVVEGGGEGEQRLVVGGFVGLRVLFGLKASDEVGGCAFRLPLGPPTDPALKTSVTGLRESAVRLAVPQCT
ncbi:hypothetical protein [Streptomyces enissocaesilis]|uniref:hypothetical protein n=1 Tax=Streptomyces enissocaesilis TaxID=332589 RepID=UPI0031D49AD7